MSTYIKCKRYLYNKQQRKDLAKELKTLAANYTYWPFTKSPLICTPTDLNNWIQRGVPTDMDCDSTHIFICALNETPRMFQEAQPKGLEEEDSNYVHDEGKCEKDLKKKDPSITLADIEDLKEQVSSFTQEVVRVNSTTQWELKKNQEMIKDTLARIFELEETFKKMETRLKSVKLVIPEI